MKADHPQETDRGGPQRGGGGPDGMLGQRNANREVGKKQTKDRTQCNGKDDEPERTASQRWGPQHTVQSKGGVAVLLELRGKRPKKG